MAWWIYALAAIAITSLGLLFVLLVALRVSVRYTLEEPGNMGQPGFVHTLVGLTSSPERPVTQARLYGDVDEIYDSMLEAIHGAQHTITFETYLFWSGTITDRFVEAFGERARAGVKVKLLLDADGSRFLTRRTLQALKDSGCDVRMFRPFLWYQPVQYNHRTHRKLLVVDGKVGFTGGIGISDIWYGPPKWLEVMVRLEGGVVGLLQGAFFQNWVIAGGALCLGDDFFPEIEDDPHAKAMAMVTTSSPIWGDSSMRLLYYSSIASAQKTLYLITPYFLPNWDTIAALGAAAARGVDVRLLLPGPRNDKALPYFASRRLYGLLLAAGVRIYEYMPSMMHAKAMVIDGRWVTLGSTNFDPRSFFLNSELNMSIDDPGFASEMESFFMQALAQSKEQHYHEWRKRGLKEHVLGWMGLVIKDQL
ncbi:putative cardiolipin synthase YwiE [compost metagenome]